MILATARDARRVPPAEVLRCPGCGHRRVVVSTRRDPCKTVLVTECRMCGAEGKLVERTGVS